MPEKQITKNTTLVTAGAGTGALVVWAWNGFMPDYQMPAEVAAILAGLIGTILGRFLPTPGV